MRKTSLKGILHLFRQVATAIGDFFSSNNNNRDFRRLKDFISS